MAKRQAHWIHLPEGGRLSNLSGTSLAADRTFLKLLNDVRAMIESARSQVARAVDAGMVLLYWNLGRRIQRDILREKRAGYGDQIVQTLSGKCGRLMDDALEKVQFSSMPISHATARGPRAEQQDRFVSLRLGAADLPHGGGQLMAVIDGHGGQAVAECIARELPGIFEQALRRQNGDVATALKTLVSQLEERTRQEPSGATLSVAYIPDEESAVYAAVLGDSPVIVLDDREAIHCSPIHNVRTNLEERAAAVARGAVYAGGYIGAPELPDEGLQPSRALGDCRLARIINREPEIYRVGLGEKSLVILATDGLIEPFNPDIETQMKRVVELARRGDQAEALVADALGRKTGDNVTVVVWKR